MYNNMNIQEERVKNRSVASPIVVIIVVALHVLAIGGFVFLQGCEITSPRSQPPPAKVVQPIEQSQKATKLPPPQFQPPASKWDSEAVLGGGAQSLVRRLGYLRRFQHGFSLVLRVGGRFLTGAPPFPLQESLYPHRRP